MLTSKVTKLTPAIRPRSERLRAAILDVARNLCFSGGIEAVSARKIAREVGCSPTAIYLYYRNIDDVLHHLRMEGHTLLAESFRQVEPTFAPRARLVEMGRAYFRFGIERPKYYQLMFLSRFRDTTEREFTHREIFTLLMVRDVAEEGIERGEIRDDLDPMILANGLWAKMHGLTSLAVAGMLRHTAPGRQDELLDAVLDGVDRWVRP